MDSSLVSDLMIIASYRLLRTTYVSIQLYIFQLISFTTVLLRLSLYIMSIMNPTTKQRPIQLSGVRGLSWPSKMPLIMPIQSLMLSKIMYKTTIKYLFLAVSSMLDSMNSMLNMLSNHINLLIYIGVMINILKQNMSSSKQHTLINIYVVYMQNAITMYVFRLYSEIWMAFTQRAKVTMEIKMYTAFSHKYRLSVVSITPMVSIIVKMHSTSKITMQLTVLFAQNSLDLTVIRV